MRKLHHWLNQEKENVDEIKDVYNGKLYKNQCRFGFSNDLHHLNDRGLILNGTADTPARATFLNIPCHNSHYNTCAQCLTEGVRVSVWYCMVSKFTYCWEHGSWCWLSSKYLTWSKTCWCSRSIRTYSSPAVSFWICASYRNWWDACVVFAIVKRFWTLWFSPEYHMYIYF